jgi:flagellar hook-basal body complex protein FliE
MILTRVERGECIDCLYDSSNILASSYNTSNSNLTITFKRGTQYIYNTVSKRDYTRFELAESQGAVMNSHIKAYSFIKGNDVNTEALINEINQAKPKELTDLEKEFVELLKNTISTIEKEKEVSEIQLEEIVEASGKLLINVISEENGK